MRITKYHLITQTPDGKLHPHVMLSGKLYVYESSDGVFFSLNGWEQFEVFKFIAFPIAEEKR